MLRWYASLAFEGNRADGHVTLRLLLQAACLLEFRASHTALTDHLMLRDNKDIKIIVSLDNELKVFFCYFFLGSDLL